MFISIGSEKEDENAQMLEHSFHTEGTVKLGRVKRAEGVKYSYTYIKDIVTSDPSQFPSWTRLITTEATIQLVYGPCGSVCVSMKVLIKHLVSECKFSRKYDNILRAHIY